jgi:CRISPR-associated endonuclease/helicase Cas3
MISGSTLRHSTAGAIEARALGDLPTAFCIAGHHAGLPDRGNRTDTADSSTLLGRFKRTVGTQLDDYSAYRNEIHVPDARPASFGRDAAGAFFYIKMLFSCLVDADFLDTEAFVTRGQVKRGGYADLPDLWEMLRRKIEPWFDAKSDINQKRSKILKALIERGEEKRGLFTLTVPTGGGKTVSSMAFALRHALRNGLRRVVYVIPYTSIIEQTQDVFEDIFGPENIVAHYANVDYPTGEDRKEKDRPVLASENWDAPIILTTAVQFFESLYASRPSRCRKLHNLADSVIIFDEAQMLPVPYLRPCLAAVAQLVRRFGCSAVLCTATQPSLGPLLGELLPEFPPHELCPDVSDMYGFFQRVRYVREGKLTDAELARKLMSEEQVLCIVNSRRQAQDIFQPCCPKDLFICPRL